MSLSIIIRKKDRFAAPAMLSVQKLNRYAWRKSAHRRKRSTWQKMRNLLKSFSHKKAIYRVEGQVAMF